MLAIFLILKIESCLKICYTGINGEQICICKKSIYFCTCNVVLLNFYEITT